MFHAKHPKTLLAIHSAMFLPEGLDLTAIVRELGLQDAVIFSDQYQLVTGMTDQPSLAAWYGTCDVLLSAGNEGFGLPVVEAQACGTPVITGNWGTGLELRGAGWGVDGQADWNNHHKKQWNLAYIDITCKHCGRDAVDSVAAALENSYQAAGDMQVRQQARDFALTWDADKQWAAHWAPVMAELG